MNPLRTIGAKASSLTFDEGLEYEFSEQLKVRLERPLYFNYSKGSPFPSGTLWLHHSLSLWHWRSWVIYWQWQFSELWRYPAEENRNINLGLKAHEQIGSWNSSKPSSSNTYMFISYLNIYFICVFMFNLIYYRIKQTKVSHFSKT